MRRAAARSTERTIGVLARRLGVALLVACGAVFGCAESSGGVTRMADGVRYDGRFLNPEAYSAYLEGVEHEARGEYEAALSAYLEAQTQDPESPEVWARIGAVQCVSNQPTRAREAARVAFERGLLADPAYFGNYLERARCAERARAFEAALKDARAAVSRRPDDEGANLLVARALWALGRKAGARAWLEAFHGYQSASGAALRALAATRPEVGADSKAPNPRRGSAAFRDISSGRLDSARQRAQLELAADPTNSDAWIASLVACDALRDSQCFESALTALEAPSLSPSETALGYLRELLARRAGAKITF